jgi:hypothetical protein
MDFKAILSKLDGMEAPPTTPAAPILDKAVQLNEDAQLRVLSGRTTYVAEAKKKKEEDKKEEKVDEATKTDKPWTDMKGNKHPGTAVKGDKYTGKEAEKEDKKAKKESVEPQFKSKFMKMVEAKKEESEAEAKKKKEDKKKKMAKIMDEGAKPDFLDMDKDGDKKEPMKKAVADKKAGPKKGVNPFAKKESVEEAAEMKTGEKKKSSTGGTIEKTKTGLKHTAGKNYSGKAAEAETKKKTVKESVEQKLSFREMMSLVVESGGQQQIDPLDQQLFDWATRMARSKLGEGMKAEVYAGMVYERMGGRFDMYDVLSEDQK